MQRRAPFGVGAALGRCVVVVAVLSIVASVVSLQVWQPEEAVAHPEAPSLSCRAGYTLSGGTCEGTVTSSVGADGSCEAGYTAVVSIGVVCVRTTSVAATASCGAGYTLSGGTCERTVTSSLPANGSCEAGYTAVVSIGVVCVRTTTVAATASCPSGFLLGTLWGGSFCYRTYTATPVCSGGRVFVPPNSCVNTTTLTVGSPSWDCGSGSSTGGTGCIAYATPTYSCSSGTLSGQSCEITTYGTVVYSCSVGTLSGASCVITSTLTATPTYSCSSGTLTGQSCEITTYGSVVYSCSVGTLSGASCVITSTLTATPTYSCSSGTLSGSSCEITTYGTVVYSCSVGRLSGASCVITTTVTADPIEECPDEHTLTAGMCQPDTTTTTSTPDNTTTTTSTPDNTTTTTTTSRPDNTTTTTSRPDNTTTTTTTVAPETVAAPVVAITGLTGASKEAVLFAGSFLTLFKRNFIVRPAGADCEASAEPQESRYVLPIVYGRATPERHLWVYVGGIGPVTVTVECTLQGHTEAVETVKLTTWTPGDCDLPITPGTGPIDGTWTTGCKSSQRGNDATPYYARRFTFTLAAASEVTASVSSEQATSVYVLSDPHPEDDDPHASGTTHASAPLPAGSHQIEVARSVPRRTDGSFTLTVTAAASEPVTAEECTTDLGTFSVVSRALATASSAWAQSTSCVSQNRPANRYAQYFRLTLASESIITIDLTSQHNTYLYLLDGHDSQTGYRQQNDDVDEANANRDSRLYGRLAAGQYTIEATTHDPNITGDFRLGITLMTGGFCPAPQDDSST